MYHQPSPPVETLLEQIRRDNPKRSFTRNWQGTAIGMWADGRWNMIAGWGIHGRWMRIGDLLVNGKPVTPQDDWMDVAGPLHDPKATGKPADEKSDSQVGCTFVYVATLREMTTSHDTASGDDYADERDVMVVVENAETISLGEIEQQVSQSYPEYRVVKVAKLDVDILQLRGK